MSISRDVVSSLINAGCSDKEAEMRTYCEDCGCAVYDGACTNCHESLYILDQYIDLGMALPSDDSDFMTEVARDSADVARKNPL